MPHCTYSSVVSGFISAVCWSYPKGNERFWLILQLCLSTFWSTLTLLVYKGVKVGKERNRPHFGLSVNRNSKSIGCSVYVFGSGFRMVSCGRDNIRLWRVRNGTLRSCPVNLGEYHSLDFTDVAFEEGNSSYQRLDDRTLWVSKPVWIQDLSSIWRTINMFWIWLQI